MSSSYDLLRSKNILAILDGDTAFGVYSFNDEKKNVEIKMPYLNGPALCDISTQFGFPVRYEWGAALSRWQYLNNLLEYCISEDKCSDLLAYLFDKERFSGILSDCTVEEINIAYNFITAAIIQKINGILYFGGNKLSIIGKRFVVHPIDSHPEVETPKIKNIDREYIKDISSRAMDLSLIHI